MTIREKLGAWRRGFRVENAKLYEDLKATFQQTIKGLASAIDKMDRYTAGHCQRVADYACTLAETLGFTGRDLTWRAGHAPKVAKPSAEQCSASPDGDRPGARRCLVQAGLHPSA